MKLNINLLVSTLFFFISGLFNKKLKSEDVYELIQERYSDVGEGSYVALTKPT